MRVLWVGDPHVQKSNIDESKRLAGWVRAERDSLKPDYVLLAGDLYNDFGLKRVEVDEFWTHVLSDVLPGSIVLEGNHDQTPDGTGSALSVHRDRCNLINGAAVLSRGVGGMPFIRDNAKFLETCKALYAEGARTIFCHADVNGAQYENGFYSPGGADVSGLPADLKLISGHIHKQQEFGNVWFPGTPRHLTRSDVGEKKGIWLIDTDLNQRWFLETPPEVCAPFLEVTVTPENFDVVMNSVMRLPPTDRLYVDVKGTKEFIDKAIGVLPDQAKIRTFVASTKPRSGVSESEGIPTAFVKYAAKYAAEHSLSPEVAQKVLTKVYAKCPTLRIGT